MADDTLGTMSGDSVWFGMYYDGETPSANATDPAWKFIDRTRTFDEGTTNILITWEGTYPNTSSGKNVYMNDNRKLVTLVILQIVLQFSNDHKCGFKAPVHSPNMNIYL